THNRREAELEAIHERHFSVMIFVGAILAIAVFIQFLHWDKYSLEIIPLKLHEWSKTASADQLKRIANICQDRMQYACVEGALGEVLQKNPNDLNSLYEL